MTADEIAHCIRELHDVYSASEALTWMQASHPQLEDRKPIDCPIADVQYVIDQLKSGAYL